MFWAVAPVAAEETRVEFNRDVRPILADKCFACHGPDKNRREADLRFDDEQSAKASAIVPGKPEESELIRRITTADSEERMPPSSLNRALSDREIATLRQWVAQGASWQQHWAWLPLKESAPPGNDTSTDANVIDRFIAAKLAKQGLAPSPVADPRTLVRRLYFDLIGLPPTPAEVDEFVDHPSAEAYERIVDRLLASPHFGERMAVYWLDVVRYADSGGYHSDNERSVAPYRDYVIAAFNDNLPFDQFTVEQIAGDLLPDAAFRQKVASGYNRLLQTTEEGGAQPKEYSAKYQADRVRNTAAAWLGITMGCAECHDHKFDPFTMRDFYSFGAFFADVEEKPVGRQDQAALATPEQEAQLAELDRQLGTLREEYQRSTPEFDAARDAWAAARRVELVAGNLDWKTLRPEAVASAGEQTLTIQDDLSVLASGKNPDQDVYTVTLRPGPSTITGLRLEGLLHDSLSRKSLSRANGNFVLSEISVEFQAAPDDLPQPIAIKEALADFSQDAWPVAHAIDGRAETGWAVDGHNRRENRKAVFVFAEPVAAGEEALMTVRLKHESSHAKHNIGRFRLAVTSHDKPELSDLSGLPAEVAGALQAEPEKRNDDQRRAIDQYYRSIVSSLAGVREQMAAIEKQQQEIRAAFPLTLISVSVAPRVVRILPRGNWLDDSGEVMHPAAPTALPAVRIEDRQKARLDLARWLVARDNPLTARVFVNRLWKLCFGQGLVKTLDDFGSQGQWPTHPELLDWLAIEFMDCGWNVKQMLKLMVMSKTYQQSSQVSSSLREVDPTNKWLARQARFRLDAEMVRDNALAVSGLLSRRIGGPSVKPYQPVGYWQHLNFPMREWQNDKGESQHRRGLYTHWQRSFLHPSLLAFDAPSREECTVERPRSNTPLQALVLLNDPTYVEAARALAARMMRESDSAAPDRIRFAFRAVLSRLPSGEEQAVLMDLYQKHLDEYRADSQAADKLLQVGEVPAPPDLDRADLAAWTSVARTILNLHESITRY